MAERLTSVANTESAPQNLRHALRRDLNADEARLEERRKEIETKKVEAADEAHAEDTPRGRHLDITA